MQLVVDHGLVQVVSLKAQAFDFGHWPRLSLCFVVGSNCAGGLLSSCGTNGSSLPGHYGSELVACEGFEAIFCKTALTIKIYTVNTFGLAASIRQELT